MAIKRKKSRHMQAASDATLADSSYYIMACYGQPGEAELNRVSYLPPGIDNWMEGSLITEPFELPVRYVIAEGEGGIMLPLYEDAVPLISKELLTLLGKAGVDNLQTFDAIIEDRDNNQIIETCKAMNIVGVVSMVDDEASEFESLGLGDGRFYTRLALRSDCSSDLLMFRLQESLSAIVVHKKIREAIENSSITGLSFVHPSDYRG